MNYCPQTCNQGRNNCQCSPQYDLKGLYNKVLIVVVVALVLGSIPAVLSSKPVKTFEKECLAEAIHQEARGETTKGKLAVAQVVLNRVKDLRFPKTICGVVFQPGQFSWTRTWNTWNYPPQTEALAQQVLDNNRALMNFKATHFHNRTVDPDWNLQPVTTIGNHIFYK